MVYNKELKFYLEYFFAQDLLKETINADIHFEAILQKFKKYYLHSDIPEYTDYQFVIALQFIDKFQVVKHLDLYKIRRNLDYPNPNTQYFL